MANGNEVSGGFGRVIAQREAHLVEVRRRLGNIRPPMTVCTCTCMRDIDEFSLRI